jgi:predicted phage terminase large subunit-like protein
MKAPTKEKAYLAAVRGDFRMFVHQTFSTLYPDKEFVPNWHISAIAHALERSLAGEVPRLLINLPPRHLKSFLISVAWPAFLLGLNPSLKIFCVSYSDDLARAIARDFKRIVESPWYRMLFPHVRLSKITENEIATDAGGFRAAMSVHGSITGRGADLIIVDDPCRPEEALSDKARMALNEWFRSTLLSRRDDKRRSGLIVVMQRLHVNDLTGFIEQDGDALKLSFPAIALRDESSPLGQGQTYFRRAGEPLQAELEDLDVLGRLRRDIGPYNFEAQYQQSPRTPDGSLFKRKYFRLITERPAESPSGEYFISVDSALSTSSTSDYTAISIVYIDKGRLYVLKAERGRWEYEDLKARVLQWAKQLHRAGKAVHVVVEYAGSGISLYQFLNKAKTNWIYPFYRTPKEDKMTRAAAVLPWVEAGIYILDRAGRNEWVEPFLNEFMNFPNGANDDQVDSLVQLLHWARVRLMLPRPATLLDRSD